MKPRAVAMTAKERAELVSVEGPKPLGPTEVRGPTLVTLISPGTELAHHYLGETFPSFPGYAAVFRAEEVGAEVREVNTGDVLFCMGPHRSVQQADSSSIVPVPEGLSPEIAVVARLMGVSMTTLTTSLVRTGDLVIVSGAGPVGFLAAHVFQNAGYDVLGVEPNDARREDLRASGISPVFPSFPLEDPALAGRVALVVECSGHERAALDACRIVRKRGEVVLVGVPWKRRTDLPMHDLLHAVFHRYVMLRSGWEWELPHHSDDFRPHSIFSNFRTALKWLSEGRIPVEDRITLSSPEAVSSTYAQLHEGSYPGLFPVLDWR